MRSQSQQKKAKSDKENQIEREESATSILEEKFDWKISRNGKSKQKGSAATINHGCVNFCRPGVHFCDKPPLPPPPRTLREHTTIDAGASAALTLRRDPPVSVLGEIDGGGGSSSSRSSSKGSGSSSSDVQNQHNRDRNDFNGTDHYVNVFRRLTTLDRKSPDSVGKQTNPVKCALFTKIHI